MTFNVENGDGFLQPMVSLFDTNMKPPKQLTAFLTGFFSLLSQETWAFMANFTSR